MNTFFNREEDHPVKGPRRKPKPPERNWLIAILWMILQKLNRIEKNCVTNLNTVEASIKREINESERRIIAKLGAAVDLTDEFSDVKEDIRMIKGIAPRKVDVTH